MDAVESPPLVAWLGDDFTGAAATMEVLTFAGLPSVLFLTPPSPEQLARFSGMRGIGLATMARTWGPDRMRRELPLLFQTLAATGAELVHYKVCTTLDSAPHIGSIGAAMEIGRTCFRLASIPILVAAPAMRRYQTFGHLFAAAGDRVERIDRHPVMARHPVTPIGESDVARHIGAQTDLPLGCLDIESLVDREACARTLADADGPVGWTLDQMGPAEESAAGALIWEGRATNPFVIGSQGVQFALVRHWRETSALESAPPPPGLGRATRMAVVSGSVSPSTASQIAWAAGQGFAPIAFDATALCAGPGEAAAAEEAALRDAREALDRGTVPIIHSAAGPDDPAVARLEAVRGDLPREEVNDRIGKALGRVLKQLVEQAGLRRAVVSGGDTSGHVCAELGIYALTALAPTIPGASINRAYSTGSMDGLELALKGGQMGSMDYFGWIRDGGGAR